MNIVRNELRTGLLVIVTMGVFAAVLVYLAAPGMLRKMDHFTIYFDNAGGIQIGAPVMLAGRRVGQVLQMNSPVAEGQRPRPNLEAEVEVEIHKGARLYRNAKAYMLQYGLLGEQVIDFIGGSETSGIASAQTKFVGERQLGLNEAAPKLVEKLDPVLKSAKSTIEELHKTASNLSALTAPDADLPTTFSNFKAVSDNLVEMSGTDGSLRKAFHNIEAMTGDESPLAQTLRNANEFTGKLANNKDIETSLQNFRQVSRNLNSTVVGLRGTVGKISPGLKQTVHNAEQFSDTLKHQPWRLIWPSTKKYADDKPSPTPAPIAERRGARPVKGTRTVPSPTPQPSPKVNKRELPPKMGLDK